MITLCSARQTCEKGFGTRYCKNKSPDDPQVPWGCEIGKGGCYNKWCTCPKGESCGYPLRGSSKICRKNLFIIFLNFCIPDHLLMKL
jgi:hypothetical protein